MQIYSDETRLCGVSKVVQKQAVQLGRGKSSG